MSIPASQARKELFPLIEKVNADRVAVEITSRRGNAVLLSAEEYAALEETASLLRVPAERDAHFSRACSRRGPETCTNTSSWIRGLSSRLTAGHDYTYWLQADRRILKRINRLIGDAAARIRQPGSASRSRSSTCSPGHGLVASPTSIGWSTSSMATT